MENKIEETYGKHKKMNTKEYYKELKELHKLNPKMFMDADEWLKLHKADENGK